MKVRKVAGSAVFLLLALVLGPSSHAFPQNGPQTLPYSEAEYDAYMAARREQHPQKALKLLDDFAVRYPDSSLLPYTYLSYASMFFVLGNNPKAVDYADKFLASGDHRVVSAPSAGMFGQEWHLEALYVRAQAYFSGCYENPLHTANADVKARQAAEQGLQELDQWQQKPRAMTEEQFDALKRQIGLQFRSVEAVAESVLKGGNPADSCRAASAPDPRRFNDVLNGIADQNQSSPGRR